MTDLPLYEQVGFDYAMALLEMRRQLSYQQMADALGYSSKAGISKVLAGAIPAHRQGEAIWALYVQMFGKKPPMIVHRGVRSALKI